MSLSRQERRRMAREASKRSAFEQRYGRQIEERQNNVDDRVGNSTQPVWGWLSLICTAICREG